MDIIILYYIIFLAIFIGSVVLGGSILLFHYATTINIDYIVLFAIISALRRYNIIYTVVILHSIAIYIGYIAI